MNKEEKRLDSLLQDLAGAAVIMDSVMIDFTNKVYGWSVNKLQDFFIEVNADAFCVGDNAARFPIMVAEFCLNISKNYVKGEDIDFDEKLGIYIRHYGQDIYNFYKQLKRR